MSVISSINPSTGKVLGKVQSSTPKQIKQKVDQASKTKQFWKEIGLKERIKLTRKIVNELEKNKEEMALLASKEMGMPITMSRADVGDSIYFLNWYLDNAEKYLSEELVYEDKKVIHKVRYEPYGVAATITPWNFPASNFIWMVGQSLIAGNTIVFKDSEEVPLFGELLEQIIDHAGLPKGVFSEIYGDGRIGDKLVHQNIDLICFTGSSNTGKYLYKVSAEKFIRALLELGGSAPGVIFEDADLEKTISTVYANRFDNCGQICDGLKRLIVHKSKLNDVLEALLSKLDDVKVGDALDEETDIGPLVSKKQLRLLVDQVNDAKDKGAKVVVGGKKLNDLSGFFYEPTLLTGIKKNMRVWNEEVFGPVLPIVTFTKEEEAINLAKDTEYGLGGYVFTEDIDRFERIVSKLNTGMIQMNTASYLSPATPFGGCKISGLGREHGKFGFHEVTQVKTISYEK